ncbi:hypothetical protein RJ640_002447, partial [Escallonia rubra]
MIGTITQAQGILNGLLSMQRPDEEAKSGQGIKQPSFLPEQGCLRFSLAEIHLASQNFDDALILGKGGFGNVYQGLVNIDNVQSLVAIKRLNSTSSQGALEFWTEIEMLSKFRHCHLVSLIGYCDEQNEMILVYEYMCNGTLADHLHKVGKNGNPPLSWVQRLKICIGSARGLDYLHTGTGVQHRVIHRDVKSSNILLDEHWAAKVSDFGLSKIGPANQSFSYVSTNVKGTHGYLDPEYFLTYRLTRKTDVYAFGVVLFEVLSGRPAVDARLNETQLGLAAWARRCVKDGKVERIVDPNLREGRVSPKSLGKFVEIADRCLRRRPEERPTMARVVACLELALKLQEGWDSSNVGGETFSTKVRLFFLGKSPVNTADHLHKVGKNGNPPLSWVQRLKICIGSARGLDYLHTGTGVQHRVIHRDVKSSNILLDEHWAAKVSDFGLSKIGPANQSFSYVSTNVKGTHGYLDPEYFLTYRLTRKTDVYAFGVVLFEVLSGRPAVDARLNEKELGLAAWARRCVKDGKVERIVDPNLREGRVSPKSLGKFVKIADRCLRRRPEERPTMARVVACLELALKLQEGWDSSNVGGETFSTKVRLFFLGKSPVNT